MEAGELLKKLSMVPPGCRVFIGRPDLEDTRFELTEIDTEKIDIPTGEELVVMLNSAKVEEAVSDG